MSETTQVKHTPITDGVLTASLTTLRCAASNEEKLDEAADLIRVLGTLCMTFERTRSELLGAILPMADRFEALHMYELSNTDRRIAEHARAVIAKAEGASCFSQTTSSK